MLTDVNSIKTTLENLYQNWSYLKTHMPDFFLKEGNSLCVFKMQDVALPVRKHDSKDLSAATSHQKMQLNQHWGDLSGNLRAFQHTLLLSGPTPTDDENINDWLGGFSLLLASNGMILFTHHFPGCSSVLHSPEDIAKALNHHSKLNCLPRFSTFQIEDPNTHHIYGKIKAHNAANAIARFHALTLSLFDKEHISATPL